MDKKEEEIENLIEENTRKELNEIASEEGIKDPESYPRKRDLAEEIVEARTAKEHINKPTGLYIEPGD